MGTVVKLPRYARRFIGRSRDIAEIEARFGAGSRIVSLVGVAGIGKTRLAVEVAKRCAPARSKTILFCDLTDARDATDICASLARALELALPSDASLSVASAAVERALAVASPAFVVFDNFEGAADAADDTLSRWAAGVPELAALVTSRVPLHIADEVVVSLGPLSVTSLSAEQPSEAMTLFLDRASSVCSTSWESKSEVLAIASAMTRLEGLPLALELAAARMAVLSPADLERSLSNALGLLARAPLGATRAAGDEHRRHSSMRAALELSVEALDPPLRRAFALASVFRGGFTLEAFEHVLQPKAGDLSALDGIQVLVDRSLVRTDTTESGCRFAMYSVVHELASEKLQAADESAALERHADWFGEQARALVFAGRRGCESGVIAASLADRENLLAVATRAGPSLTTAAAHVTTALGVLHAHRGEPAFLRLIAGLRRGDAKAIEHLPDDVAADLALAIAEACRTGGELDDALRWTDAALARGEAIDASVAACIHVERSFIHLRGGRVDDARADLERARELARGGGEFSLEANVELVLANLRIHVGDLDAGTAHAERALTLARRAGNGPLESRGEFIYAFAAAEAGDGTEALARYLRGRDLAADGGARAFAAFCTVMAGATALSLQPGPEAMTWLEEGLREARRHGHVRGEAMALTFRGVSRHIKGETALAAKDYQSALDFEAVTNDVWVGARILSLQGAALAELGRCGAAGSAFDAAERACAAEGLAPARRAADLAQLRALRGVLDAALALEAMARGDHAAAGRHREQASARLGDAQRTFTSSKTTNQRAIAMSMMLVARAIDRIEPPADALVVATDGTWMRPPNGERVELVKKPLLARLVLELVDHHAQRKVGALSRQELARALWPGERIAEHHAMNRVAVSLAKLRQLGLRDLIETLPDGIRLRPDVRIVRRDTT